MSSTRILVLYGVISVLVQILSCANLRSIIGSNSRFPFSERRGLQERDDGYEDSSYLRPKYENQPVGFNQLITSHSSISSSYHRLHNLPWGPARMMHKSHSTDFGHPMSADIAPRITSQMNRNIGSSFQLNDDLFKRRVLQDTSISSEDIFKDVSSPEGVSEEIRRRVSSENWVSEALDEAFYKLDTLFDGSEEEEERCVQEALWEKYGEFLKRRFKDCDFFLEDDQSRWRRYIARIQTCSKGWRKVRRSCRTVYSKH